MIRIRGDHSVFEWYVTATKSKPSYLVTETERGITFRNNSIRSFSLSEISDKG